jgi:hypothetical protein
MNFRDFESQKVLEDWPNKWRCITVPMEVSPVALFKHYLDMHIDDNFFYSLTMVASAYRHDIDRYNMDAEVCKYLTFVKQ